MMLSDKLKELRKQSDLPQRKVAAALDIDTATYCKIENGNYSPKRELILELARNLRMDFVLHQIGSGVVRDWNC